MLQGLLEHNTGSASFWENLISSPPSLPTIYIDVAFSGSSPGELTAISQLMGTAAYVRERFCTLTFSVQSVFTPQAESWEIRQVCAPGHSKDQPESR